MNAWKMTREEYVNAWIDSIIKKEIARAGRYTTEGIKEKIYFVPESIKEALQKLGKTEEEYLQEYKKAHFQEIAEGHEIEVKLAIRRGEIVPDRVLRDYPELIN